MGNKYSIADELDTWQKQQDYLFIMKALSNKFDSVYILNMDTGIVVPFFLSEKNKLEYQDAFDRGAMWEDLRWEYGSKYVHKEYKEDFRRNARLSKIRSEMAANGFYKYEYKNDRDGITHYFEMKVAKLSEHDENKVIIGFADIDYYKKIEEKSVTLSKQIQQAEASYRVVQKLMKSGMWSMEFDENGKMQGITWTDEFRRMIGYQSEADFPNDLNSWSHILHPEDWNTAYNSIWKSVNDYSGNTEYDQTYRLKTRNNGWRWFRATGDVIRRDDGSPMRFFGIFLDVTEQHERESLERSRNMALERANRSAEAFNALHEALGSGLWSMEYDKDAHVVSVCWSEKLRKMLGYSNEFEFPNVFETLRDRVHPDYREMAMTLFDNALKDYSGKTTFDIENPVKTKNHGYRWFRAAGRFTRRSDGSPISFIGLFMDIDDKVRQNELLKNALHAADAASNAKTSFLANMSHDIRTPMNGIIGMTAIASANLDDKEKVKDALNKINGASQHLLNLINEVLDMSKIESGKVHLNEEAFSLSYLVDNMMSMVRSQLEKHNHDCRLFMSNIVHDNVIGDSLRVQQILMNFMSNAIKYTPDGGRISIEISEKPIRQSGVGLYEIIFRDNGIGMTPEFAATIFDPFSRAEDSRANKIQGTGLGMSIARSIVRMMGGDIQVETKLNKGSKFTITFCLKFQEKPVENQSALDNDDDMLVEFEEADFFGSRVLLVEDNDLNAEIAQEILEMTGLDVERAEDGLVAVDKIEKCEDGYYDLILMDIQMPKMNGYDATRVIRAMNRDYCKRVPILAMTANAFSEDVRSAKHAGMNAHLSKPLELDKLARSLHRWLKK
jgi:PAS domain S-box-containing protein